MSIHRTPPPETLKRQNLDNTPLTSFASDPQLYKSTHCQEIGDSLDFISRRTKRKFEHEAKSSEKTVLQQMKSLFDTFEAQQNLKLEKIIQSTQTIKDQNTEIQTSIEFLSSKYDDAMERILTLEQKNKAYETKIGNLESKIEQLERNSRSSMIEIRNIPKQTPENKTALRTLVKKVGEIIEQPVSDSDIQDVYRIKSKKESSNHIVVNFTTTTCKDGFIGNCRSFNKANKEKKLSTSHLKLSGPSKPIFIDESLTSYGRRLAFLARQLAHENHYSTWTSYGKVYIRKTTDSPAVRIDSEQDLNQIEK
ncbi:hypothetical protein JYU34_001244 [Plutella xylostella]|uniref:FP protein C-terminal domain-containing protein n=1 Tax=Plutella xylostella TaxID=51655 RepID=A0ABQ7R6D3_PLUXY|nr:hypothetical protein JYU34_001244 [Plutella xylostella]